MLFFIKKFLTIRYSCRFQGFSKHTRFCILYSFCFSALYLRHTSFQQLLQYFLRFDVCLINLLFHNIENAEFLLKNFSQSAIHAGLQDFLNIHAFVSYILFAFLHYIYAILPSNNYCNISYGLMFAYSLPLIEKWGNKSQNPLFMQVCRIF
jgi:hypothetical protein